MPSLQPGGGQRCPAPAARPGLWGKDGARGVAQHAAHATALTAQGQRVDRRGGLAAVHLGCSLQDAVRGVLVQGRAGQAEREAGWRVPLAGAEPPPCSSTTVRLESKSGSRDGRASRHRGPLRLIRHGGGANASNRLSPIIPSCAPACSQSARPASCVVIRRPGPGA